MSRGAKGRPRPPEAQANLALLKATARLVRAMGGGAVELVADAAQALDVVGANVTVRLYTAAPRFKPYVATDASLTIDEVEFRARAYRDPTDAEAGRVPEAAATTHGTLVLERRSPGAS